MLDVKSHFICGKPKIYEKAEIVKTVTLQKQFFWDSIVVKIFKQSRSENTALYIVVLECQYQRKKRGYPKPEKGNTDVILDNVPYNKIKNVQLDMNIGNKIKSKLKAMVKKGFLYSKAYQNFLTSE